MWVRYAFLVVCLGGVLFALQEDPRYDVLIVPSKREIEDEEGTVIVEMTSAEGQRYSCHIPPPPLSKTSSTSTPQPTAEYVTSVLSPLSEMCLYRLAGWWTYEVCHGKSVRQYHQQDTTLVVEHLLGLMNNPKEIETTGVVHIPKKNAQDDPSHTKKVEEKKTGTGTNTNTKEQTGTGDTPYFSVMYKDGTVCDLTGLPRTSEVRYFCGDTKGNSLIADHSEPSSCNYLFIVNTPLLCSIGAFKPQQEEVRNISCKIIEEGDILEEDLSDITLDAPTFAEVPPVSRT